MLRQGVGGSSALASGQAVVSGGSAPDVVVFNNHGVGQYVRVHKAPVMGETVLGTGWRLEQDGGKGSNAAVALGRLGVRTAFMGLLGADPWGRMGLEWMRDAGVDVSRVRVSPDVTTCTGLIVVDDAGRNMIIVGESSTNHMTPGEIQEDLEAFSGARIFVSGFEIDHRLAMYAVGLARGRGMRTLLNVSPVPEEPPDDLRDVDVLIINETEGLALLGPGADTGVPFGDVARAVEARYRPGCVVLTLGDRGCIVSEKGVLTAIPAVTCDAVDTTGAGDGFLAALAASLTWGKSVSEAAAWAVRYAAYTVSRWGTIPSYPALKTAEEFIASRG